MGTSAVEFKDVWKRFRLGETHRSLRELLAAQFSRVWKRSTNKKSSNTFWALQGVNFSVARGEALGIIGPNGAGKSTALKLLAGILRADRGSVTVNGRLAALIEVGAGFHGDLTGRENIYLNGSILGMPRKEITSKLDAIVAFAGIDRFLDMPVKRYSSGMYARLGFSIAAHVDPEIFLVDEVLSVGDAVFRLRCLERMRELVRNGTTLVFVTHNLDQMQAICGRAVVLDGGKCAYSGAPRDAVAHYMTAMSKSYALRSTDTPTDEACVETDMKLTNFRLLDADQQECVWVQSLKPFQVELTFEAIHPVEQTVVELNLRASAGENLASLNSGRDGVTFHVKRGVNTLLVSIPRLAVGSGQYFWNVRVWDAKRNVTLVDTPFRYPVVVDDGGLTTGQLCVEHEWSFASSPQTEPATSISTRKSIEENPEGVRDEVVHLR